MAKKFEDYVEETEKRCGDNEIPNEEGLMRIMLNNHAEEIEKLREEVEKLKNHKHE